MFNWLALPDEILTVIFLKLPAKALVRRLCVCKLWNSFISSPDFITTLLDHHSKLNINSESRLFLMWYRFHSRGGPGCVRFSLSSVGDETFDEHREFPSQVLSKYQEEEYPLHVLGSCNGVNCLHNTLRNGLEIFLWNPTIDRIVNVPRPPSSFSPKLHRQWYFMGFGFDPESNDYKLSRVTRTVEGPVDFLDLIDVDIYSLRFITWRSSNHTAPPPNYSHSSRGRNQVYLNGIIHWIAHYRDKNFVPNYLISWYDMTGDVFGELMIPQALDGSITFISLTVLEDSLSFSQYDDDNGKCHIWLIKEYGVLRSWSKWHSIDFHGYLPLVHEPSKTGGILLSLADDKAYPTEARLAFIFLAWLKR